MNDTSKSKEQIAAELKYQSAGDFMNHISDDMLTDFERQAFIEGAKWYAQQQREEPWVRVEDGLPEFGELVLVYCNIYGRYIGSYQRIGDTDWGNWHDGKQLGVLPPTHWKPLPPHPQKIKT